MASKYWLKMYHEALHDPELATLPNNLWRRFWECCLLAGELDEGGFLPELNSIAWTVRVGEETLKSEMGQLAQSGFIELKLDGSTERWFVSNFSKRQAPSTAAKRMKEYRSRLREEKEEIKEEKTDTDNRYIVNNNSYVTGVTFRNEDVSNAPPNDGFATSGHIQPIITALSKIAQQTYWEPTHKVYDDAALILFGYDATPELIAEFGKVWDANNYYSDKGRPALKTIVDEYRNWQAGTFPRIKKQTNGSNGTSSGETAADLVKRAMENISK